MKPEEFIQILLTPDGKGITKKGQSLIELCETVNPNLVRAEVNKILENNKSKAKTA